jgi:hypothetical protein
MNWREGSCSEYSCGQHCDACQKTCLENLHLKALVYVF